VGVHRTKPTGDRGRGQGLVEFALVAPLLLLLLLATVEFGQAFMGWVTLNNATRVAASYAATHPDTWPTVDGSPPGDYAAAIAASLGAVGCSVEDAAPAPEFGADKAPGTLVRVTMSCTYRISAPVLSAVLGNQVRLTASTAYPITGGCIANCGSAPATPPPSTGAESGCRTVPKLVGLSVLGARTAWVNAGFVADNFSADVDEATRTVQDVTLTVPAGTPPCSASQRFFTTAVSVEVSELASPPPTATCTFVPNLLGMTVADARETWLAWAVGGPFTPASGADAQIVFQQVTSPVTVPGECVEPPLTGVAVAYAPPPPPPPAAPCQVPSLVNTMTGTTDDPTGLAEDSWTGAGFTGELTFHHPKLPWMIKAQTLVGGSYQACDASMEVRR
jgi:Flp pilus assembly protein TadG